MTNHCTDACGKVIVIVKITLSSDQKKGMKSTNSRSKRTKIQVRLRSPILVFKVKRSWSVKGKKIPTTMQNENGRQDRCVSPVPLTLEKLHFLSYKAYTFFPCLSEASGSVNRSDALVRTGGCPFVPGEVRNSPKCHRVDHVTLNTFDQKWGKTKE